jgi:hypothetical protein
LNENNNYYNQSDPKSLWKNIESDKKHLWKEDNVAVSSDFLDKR